MLQISPYLFFLLLFASPLFGQQLPLSQEYQQQAFFLNPASLGQEGVQQIQLGYKQQWLNMPESPRTASLPINIGRKIKIWLGDWPCNKTERP